MEAGTAIWVCVADAGIIMAGAEAAVIIMAGVIAGTTDQY